MSAGQYVRDPGPMLRASGTAGSPKSPTGLAARPRASILHRWRCILCVEHCAAPHVWGVGQPPSKDCRRTTANINDHLDATLPVAVYAGQTYLRPMSTSLLDKFLGVHRRSATAASLGHTLVMKFVASTASPQIAPCPPITSFFCAGVPSKFRGSQ